jgi:transposase
MRSFAKRCGAGENRNRTSGKLKGRGNTKNGNRYLAWAYLEAANFAVRCSPEIKRFYSA